MAYIQLKNVSLQYPIFDAGHRSIRHEVINRFIGGHITRKPKHTGVYIDALTDISLEVRQGERIALLGHNGAGKSSLLKILAGIYPPSKGHIHTEGQVGTVFGLSPGAILECSGYDNIVRMLMLLGLSKLQAKTKIAEITEFTELHNFLHLPVRTYSQGMIVRLMFAIATSINPDILLIDEILGVGDEAFIEKSIRRVETIITNASIVVLATHSKPLAEKFCTRFIHMQHGQFTK